MVFSDKLSVNGGKKP